MDDFEDKPRRSEDSKPRYPYRAAPPRPTSSEIIFGVQTVLEALRAGKEIDKLMVLRELGSIEVIEFARLRDVPVQKVPRQKLDQITRKNHQGVIAFVSVVPYARLENIVASAYEAARTPFLLVLDRITDVRNFGAIARTAECVGVQALVVPVRGAAQINADAMKTSSGALNFLPVCREAHLPQTIRDLQASGIQVIACTEKAANNLYEIDLTGPVAIVMGSEEDGISDDILRIADTLVGIPMAGRVASLNVSVAAGVVLYEALRQRSVPEPKQ